MKNKCNKNQTELLEMKDVIIEGQKLISGLNRDLTTMLGKSAN